MLENIILTTKKSHKIGTIWETDSGKSILLAINMCLLRPRCWELLVGGRILKTDAEYEDFQIYIAHLSQSFFLKKRLLQKI